MGTYEDRVKDCFSDHIAHYSIFTNEYNKSIEVLEWSRLNSICYLVRYIRYKNILSVSGDMGFAIYRFANGVEVDLESISYYDYNYFSEKCEAS